MPVTIEYRQPAQAQGFRVLSESKRHTTKNGDVLWTFKLKPGGRASLSYTFRQDDDFF